MKFQVSVFSKVNIECSGSNGAVLSRRVGGVEEYVDDIHA